MATAFATLYSKMCDGCVQSYNVRLNTMSARLMGSANYCVVYRTNGHKHIVIKPLHGVCAADEPGAKRFQRDRWNAIICLSKYVSSGEISKRIFEEGGRYKVKRGKDGELYVCLQEKLEKEADGDGALGA